MRGHEISFDKQIIALPLRIYFVIIFVASFLNGKAWVADYLQNTSIAITAAGNNFELALALAIRVFEIYSSQAFAGLVAPWCALWCYSAIEQVMCDLPVYNQLQANGAAQE